MLYGYVPRALLSIDMGRMCSAFSTPDVRGIADRILVVDGGAVAAVNVASVAGWSESCGAMFPASTGV